MAYATVGSERQNMSLLSQLQKDENGRIERQWLRKVPSGES